MIKILRFSFLLTISSLVACAQNSENKYERYTEYEIKAEQCLDTFLESKQVSWDELSSIFEQYFIENGITNSEQSKQEQYQAILKYWEKPSLPFPAFKNKTRVLEIIDQLELTEDDIFAKKQLNCLLEVYNEDEQNIAMDSALQIFGITLRKIATDPGMHPGRVATDLNRGILDSAFGMPVNQKAIVLLHIFEMGILLPDGG